MRSTRIGPIKISTCSIRWVSSRKSPANIGGLCIYASLCPREIAMREISFEGAFQNCTNVNVSSKTDFWWNSIVWKNKIILNYTLIMDPTYYFHIFPVYVPWIVYIYTWFKLIRIKSTEVYLEYRWYYRSFCISKWFSVILFILKSLILTLKMEVQKFRKFSANPFESIFKVNDSH